MIEERLRKAWSDIESIVEVTGGDSSEVFLKFINEDYIDIIDKSCDEATSCGEDSKAILLSPPYAPEAHASETEKNERILLLLVSTVEQSRAAELGMNEAYRVYRNNQPASHLKYLPENPTIQVAVQHYYSALNKK